MASDIQYILINSVPESHWTDDVPAIASVFIALLALFVTLYQSHLSRKHNRLSVKPHLAIHSEEDDDTFKIIIKNDGLGPATIDMFNIFANSVLVDGAGEKLLMTAFENLTRCTVIAIEAINTPFVLPTNQQIQLVTLKFDKNLNSIEDYLEENLRLEIKYKSIYEETFILDSDS
ncbi:hypothetical protein EMIT0P100_10685 [Pseudomonas sp. IT-P100]|uniref:hypothetical protein n=1 Tax=Pseudomonas sp. IT-P100 TaxID=3026452 RepID=UPI0039E09231